MTGLCGWIDAAGDDRPSEIVLSEMAAGLMAVPGVVEHGQVVEGAALSIKSWAAATSFHVDADVMVALEGYPYWSSAPLEKLAARDGHAAALAAAYRDHGQDLFDHLHGSFSLAIVDRKRRTVILAIDRVGIYPMCFAEVPGGGLVFGSSADAVRAHPRVTSTITPQAVFDYLSFYVIPAPRTIYSEQRKLQIGQYALYTPDGLKTAFYSKPSYNAEAGRNIELLSAELKERLQTAMHRSMVSEDATTTGAFLSGGLDSTTVCGLLAGLGEARAQSFTIGFEEEGFDERPYARIGARHFDLDYNEYVLTPGDALDLLPRMAATYDEPFGNSSAIPAFYCAKFAKDSGIDLMLAGDGGDELFAGNARYVQQGKYEHYRRIPGGIRSALLNPAIGALAGATRLSFFRRLRNYVTRAEIPLPERFQCWSVVANTDLSEIFGEDVAADVDADEPNRLMSESYFASSSQSSLQRMLRLDWQMTLADGDLRKVLRMCDLAGVRVKFPLLDDELIAFSTRIPPSLLIRRRQLRYFYKQAMRDFLPAEILTKRKHGFGMPFDGWTRSDAAFSQLMHDSLTAFKARGYLKPSFVDRIIASHRSDGADHLGDLAWDLMALELWMQRC